MKNKKETRKCILHEIKMFLILIFIIILIALYFNYFNITNKFNPDKEICYYEHPAVGEIKVGLTDCKGKLFTANCDLVKLKKRDKTNSELEIEYCNNNPDDIERCKCLKYDSSPDNLYEIKIRNTILIASGAYLKENHNISICIKSNPKTEIEKQRQQDFEDCISYLPNNVLDYADVNDDGVLERRYTSSCCFEFKEECEERGLGKWSNELREERGC